MLPVRSSRRGAFVAVFVSLAVVATVVSLGGSTESPGDRARAQARAHLQGERTSCPPGYGPVSAEPEYGASVDPALHSLIQTSAVGLLPLTCISDKHPESAMDIAALGAQRFAVMAAPTGIIPHDALLAAIQQREQVRSQGQSAANAHA